MTAAQRIAALDDLPARDLIAFTEGTLRALVEVMNSETMLNTNHKFSHCHRRTNFMGNIQQPVLRPARRVKAIP